MHVSVCLCVLLNWLKLKTKQNRWWSTREEAVEQSPLSCGLPKLVKNTKRPLTVLTEAKVQTQHHSHKTCSTKHTCRSRLPPRQSRLNLGYLKRWEAQRACVRGCPPLRCIKASPPHTSWLFVTAKHRRTLTSLEEKIKVCERPDRLGSATNPEMSELGLAALESSMTEKLWGNKWKQGTYFYYSNTLWPNSSSARGKQAWCYRCEEGGRGCVREQGWNYDVKWLKTDYSGSNPGHWFRAMSDIDLRRVERKQKINDIMYLRQSTIFKVIKASTKSTTNYNNNL